jgi:hypothetical protein
MKVTLDRIEDGCAVLLVRNDESIEFHMPACLLPEDCVEGDILDISITRDTESTEAARKRVSNLIEKLKKKNVKK